MKAKIFSKIIIAALLTAMISGIFISIANAWEFEDSDIDDFTNGANWGISTRVWVYHNNPWYYEEELHVAYRYCDYSVCTFYETLDYHFYSISGSYNMQDSTLDYTSGYQYFDVNAWDAITTAGSYFYYYGNQSLAWRSCNSAVYL